MSSRAMRRAQQKTDLPSSEPDDSLRDSDTESEGVISNQRGSAFSILQDEGGEEEDIAKDPDDAVKEEQPATAPSQATAKKKSKKKKKKKSQNQRATPVQNSAVPEDQEGYEPAKFTGKGPVHSTDGIVEDFEQLMAKQESKPELHSNKFLDNTVTSLVDCLSIDTNHLLAEIEMKKLFGNVAFGRDQDSVATRERNVPNRAGGRGQSSNQRNKSLGGSFQRRNLFAKWRETWPQAPTGGLSMEIIKQETGDVVTYSFIHNRAYQSAQQEFNMSVASMEPERLSLLLQFNPYHIATLLQVSEIFKSNRQHAESAEFIERALFSFGRSVHSTFAKNVALGRARLLFSRQENREFWLASYRQIQSLGMRGLWKTAFEWVKLLFSLDPDNDPYQLRLVIDQYALRAGAPGELLELAKVRNIFHDKSGIKDANIALSQVLAFFRENRSKECRNALEDAVSKFPWVFAMLYRKLDLSPVPRAIWGLEPPTEYDAITTELYVTRAIDLWRLPEVTAMLTALVEHLPRKEPPIKLEPISLNLARHVMLTDEPAFIALLPTELSSRPTSSSDPVPPTLDDLVEQANTFLNEAQRGELSEDSILNVVDPLDTSTTGALESGETNVNDGLNDAGH